jgi:ribonuclease HI
MELVKIKANDEFC